MNPTPTPTAPEPAGQAATVFPFEVIDSETDETIDVFESFIDAGRCAFQEADRLLRDVIVYHCAARPGSPARFRFGPDGLMRVVGIAS